MMTCRVCGRSTKTATCLVCWRWATGILDAHLWKRTYLGGL